MWFAVAILSRLFGRSCFFMIISTLQKYVIVLVGLDENSSARTSEKIVKVKRIQVGVQSVLMSHAVLLLNKMILMG
jgi:hypothetical protein